MHNYQDNTNGLRSNTTYMRLNPIIRVNNPVHVRYDKRYEELRSYCFRFLEILMAVSSWYFFSTLATILNKKLVNKDVFPLSLTFTHISISCLCDYISFQTVHRKKKVNIIKTLNWRLIKLILPLSMAMFFSKLFTYISYSYVPVSLTHTVKALQPLFNVLISYFWTGKTVSSNVVLSLLPIAFGVAYSSMNEIQFNIIGFVCALISTITGVSQSIYVKKLLHSGIDKDYLHLMNGLIAACLFFPIVLVYELYKGSYKNMNWKAMLICSIVQYLSSISSYYSISLISSLTYSIFNTFKRVAIILTSAFYFDKYLSAQNIFGICLASCGVLSYNIAIRHDEKKYKIVSIRDQVRDAPIPTIGIPQQHSFSLAANMDKYSV